MTQKKLGRYDLIRVLGKGAMGLVYEGRDPNLERRVAIKTIKVENLSDEEAAEYEARFRTEARSAARLQHPNIVSVYDSDRDGDIAFLVMEFIEGEDLKHHLDRGKRHTFEQTLAIMADLLSALDYAHRAKIVHRDIKPANLLIEASGRVKLTDFGVARIQDSGDATRTQGSMVGTLKYMSPEQVQGLPVDSRTDLFAAGVLLYQLLTGQRPFDGDSDFVIIQRIVALDPAAPTSINPALPPAIDAVLARALAKSRDQRYATALEFATALQACAGQGFDATAVAPPPSDGFGRASTWTGTVRVGESLVDTQSGIGTGTSVVAQELELVYWKDIKDSSDIEDLQGFLIKFPSGVYADLARRRLGKLGGAAGDGSTGAIRTDSAPQTDRSALEKTKVLFESGRTARPGIAPPAPSAAVTADAPARPGVDTAWDALMQAGGTGPAETTQHNARRPPASTAGAITANPVAEIGASGASAPADTTTPALSPRRMAWVLAGVVVLAGMAFGVRMWSGSNAPAEQAAALANSTAAPATVPASTADAGSTPAAPTTTTAAITTQSVAPATPARATASIAPSASPSPVTAASSAARKAAADKDRLAKAAVIPAPTGANTSATTGAAATTATTNTSAPAPAPAHPGRSPPTPIAQAVPAPAPAANASPRQACEDRSFISFQNCMSDQCAKPAFFNHPICVERRAMDRSRREAEQSR